MSFENVWRHNKFGFCRFGIRLKKSVKTKTVKLNFVSNSTLEAVDFTVSLEGVNSENSAESFMYKEVKVLEMRRKLKNWKLFYF